MKQLIKPRLVPLMGWGVLVLVALSCAQVVYFRPSGGMGNLADPVSPPVEKDSIEQATRHLAELKGSNWLQRLGGQSSSNASFETIAPAPEAEVAAQAASDLGPADPLLRGAVVVRSGKRLYLVLGSRRFQEGERIGTGETIRDLSLMSVELVSPQGRTRKVEIGIGISPATQQTTW